MMNCRECVELLADFLDGTMLAEDRRHFEQHLDACLPCFHYLETYRLTVRLTSQLSCPPLPALCEQRLRDSLAREFPEGLSTS
jgi:anti-sigma factor RsiW